MTQPIIDQQSADEAQRIVQAYLSPRWRRLDKLEAYAKGTQYAGMPHWLWPEDPDAQMAKRGPHVVDPIVQNAIGSYCDLLLGEGRWPAIKAQCSDDSDDSGIPSVWNDALAFSEDERGAVETFVGRLTEHARLTKAGADALSSAMSCSTVVTTVGARRGKLVVENLLAKWCTPTWAKNNADELESLEVRYPYTEQYWDEQARKWKTRALLYRRVLDRQCDWAYEPAEAHKDGTEPTWKPKPIGAGTVQHGYGFVPAIWWPFDRRLAPVSERDGHAIHAEQLDEIDALCRGCSQHDRAALYCGDPMPVEIGVAPNENPAPMGQRAEGIKPHPNEKLDGGMQSWGIGGQSSGDGVRKKGPGVVWRYASPTAKVELLQLHKDGLGAIAANRDDLRSSIADALGWVRDREPGSKDGGIRFTGLSGEALKWMYQKQLSRCDSYRQDFADGWLLPVVQMCLRIVLHHATVVGAGAIYLAGANEMAAMLRRFWHAVEPAAGEVLVEGDDGKRWFEPPLFVEWPAYFPPTDADKATIAKQARDDLDGGLITLHTAVVRIEPFYDDVDPNAIDQYVEDLEKAKAEKAKEFAASLGDMGGGDDDGSGAQRGAGKPKAGPDGSQDPAAGNRKGKAAGKDAGADSAA